jgi:hypothetical protein|tara:strand:- start:1175 stop:1453 length:279 start_codon:yes stop_codon:yes gene_type:complete
MKIEGMAHDRKGGAVIVTDSVHYWVDGRDYWEDEFSNKEVVAIGKIVIRGDNPVFLDTSEVKSQGIPVSTVEQLEANRNRHWIIISKIELKK